MREYARYPRRFLKLLVPFALLAIFFSIDQTASALPGSVSQPVESVASLSPATYDLEPTGPTEWTPDCTPIEVAVYESRLHVRCSQGVVDGSDTIYFWAMPATKAQYANRFLSLGSTALVAGRHLIFLYTPGDTSGAAFGCQASDCRNVYAVILK
jgi:hypothetical protein